MSNLSCSIPCFPSRLRYFSCCSTDCSYSSSIGKNGYAFYNVLTHYGTHVDPESLRGAEVGNRALRQEQDVQTLVRGKAFKSLIRYDDFEQRVAA